ncbi:MAG: hypothetical protein Q7V58_13650 [Actinomycetota bacterium]|nr:hypothetical protein [Actinomycetota bacterium]
MRSAGNFLVVTCAAVITGCALLAPTPVNAAPASGCTASIADTFGSSTPTDQVTITITVTWSDCRAGRRIQMGTQMYVDLGTVMFPRYGGLLEDAFRISSPNGTATKTYRVYVQTKGEIDRGLTVDRNAQGVVVPYVNCTVPPQPWDAPGARDDYSVDSRYSIYSADNTRLARGRSANASCTPLPAG